MWVGNVFIVHLIQRLHVASLLLFQGTKTCSCGLFASVFTRPVHCMIPYEWKQSTVYRLVTLAVISIISALKFRPDVIHPFIHHVICLTTGPQLPPKRVLHIVRSCASSFNLQYLFVSLRWSSSCLRLLPRLPVTFILPSIFPSLAWFRRQFLSQMWPIQLALLLFTLCTASLPGFKQT